MNKKLPLLVLIASAVLMIAHFIFSERYNNGFWLSTLSSLLIIIGMVLTIKDQNK